MSLGWRLIFILFHSFPCKSTGVTLDALSPHPSSFTSKGSTLNGNLVWTPGCLIIVILNVSWGSITIVNDILYPTSRSFVLGILVMVYCTFLEGEIMLHHLQTTILPLLHLLFHSTTWLPSLIIFTNFMLLLDLCLLPLQYSSFGIFFGSQI